jgi:hypothetical protein
MVIIRCNLKLQDYTDFRFFEGLKYPKLIMAQDAGSVDLLPLAANQRAT